MQAHTHAHVDYRHNYIIIYTNVPIHTNTDKNLLQLKQNLYIKINSNYLIKEVITQ